MPRIPVFGKARPCFFHVPCVGLGQVTQITRLFYRKSSRAVTALQIFETVDRNARSTGGELQKSALLLSVPAANRLPVQFLLFAAAPGHVHVMLRLKDTGAKSKRLADPDIPPMPALAKKSQTAGRLSRSTSYNSETGELPTPTTASTSNPVSKSSGANLSSLMGPSHSKDGGHSPTFPHSPTGSIKSSSTRTNC